MKDYGYKKQIGYGQDYKQYLNDLKNVFLQVFNITKESGSLWVVIDTFKQRDQIIPLPFDFSNKLKEIGWKLQDIIIWNKNKTVPWSKKGQTKNKFEYILFFTKTKNYKYFMDRVREYDTKFLKKWWIKYPERYNPKGKAIEEIWEYDIPTQGSWGNEYIKHFCPLPTDMIGRMINLTSNEEDIILDPFAGTGSVLVQAAYMNRDYIGFELNKEYVERFHNYMKSTIKVGKKNYDLLKKGVHSQEKFENTILDLRTLKYAKTIFNKLEKNLRACIEAIYVQRLSDMTKDPNKITCAKYSILIKPDSNSKKISESINNICNNPPLSKFGVESEITYFKKLKRFHNLLSGKIFRYTSKNTHKYDTTMKQNDTVPEFSILSNIKVNIIEEHFD